MNINFEELIICDEMEFVDSLFEIAEEIDKKENLCTNKHNILSKRVYRDGIEAYDIKKKSVKKVYVPEAKIEYTVNKREPLKEEAKEILKSELLAVSLDFKEVDSTLKQLAERLDLEEEHFQYINNEHEKTRQTNNLNEAINKGDLFLVERREIVFDSEYVEPELFFEKTKDIEKYDFISYAYYLLEEDNTTNNGVLIVKMFEHLLDKKLINDTEVKLLIKRYNREVERFYKQHLYRNVSI